MNFVLLRLRALTCVECIVGAGLVTAPVAAAAQQTITREAAIAAALSRGGSIAVARTVAAAARAQVRAASAYPNPAFTTSYSKDTPQYHALLDVPVDLPWLRGARIGAAQAADTSAAYTFAFARAAIRFDADTAYTQALAAAAHARLSSRNAADADSLLRMAMTRRDAGDASELDVQLATVNAGQLENVSMADALAASSALLTVQRVMGLPTDSITIALGDSLTLPAAIDSTLAGERPTLQVAAASAALRSAEETLAFERRNVWAAPAVQVGFDAHDPTVPQAGLLPTVGISLPLPLFNRNSGPVAVASAERDRAQAELALARQESRATITQALRERAVALLKAQRDQRLVASAQRVATMSLEAYREGAIALSGVLEAERNARDVLAQYIDDVAAANRSNESVRLFTLTSTAP
jgi:cobalt-zinc-cadmium efflux system outer membrane protein